MIRDACLSTLNLTMPSLCTRLGSLAVSHRDQQLGTFPRKECMEKYLGAHGWGGKTREPASGNDRNGLLGLWGQEAGAPLGSVPPLCFPVLYPVRRT